MFFEFEVDIVMFVDDDGIECEVFFDEVEVGDCMKVCFGEKILIDGVVVDGDFVVDEFMVMGEFVFVLKVDGDEVVGLMVN